MSMVDDCFAGALDTALMLDGDLHSFTFSRRSTATPTMTANINCLFITASWRDPRTHSQGLNTVVHQNQTIVIMRASDVPQQAQLYSNAYLGVDGVSYRIEVSTLEFGIWELSLQVLGTD